MIRLAGSRAQTREFGAPPTLDTVKNMCSGNRGMPEVLRIGGTEYKLVAKAFLLADKESIRLKWEREEFPTEPFFSVTFDIDMAEASLVPVAAEMINPTRKPDQGGGTTAPA